MAEGDGKRGTGGGRPKKDTVAPTEFTAELSFKNVGTPDLNNPLHTLRAYLPSVPGYSWDHLGNLHHDKDQSFAPANKPTVRSVNKAFAVEARVRNALAPGVNITKAGLSNLFLKKAPDALKAGLIPWEGSNHNLGGTPPVVRNVAKLPVDNLRPTQGITSIGSKVDPSVAAYERHLQEMRGGFRRQRGDPALRTGSLYSYDPSGQREVLMKGPRGHSDILSPVGAMAYTEGRSGAYSGGNFPLSTIPLSQARGSGYFTHRNNPMLRQDNVSNAQSMHPKYDFGVKAFVDETGKIVGKPTGLDSKGFTPSKNTTDNSTIFKLGGLHESVIPGDLARSRALSSAGRAGGTGSNIDNLVNLLTKTASSDSALGQLVAVTKPAFGGASGSFSGQGLGSNPYIRSGGAQGPWTVDYGRERAQGGDQGFGKPSLSGQHREGLPTSRWGSGASFMGGTGNVAATGGGKGVGVRGVGPGGAKEAGGFANQLTQQLGHAAAWQLYMPAIMGVSYMAGKALSGDPYTDRSIQQLIGVGADSERRAEAKKWGYQVTNAIPFSRPQHYIGAFKEAASGLGIPLTAKNQLGLQQAAEQAMTFSMFSMEEPGTAARRLSRATLMEANAKGVKTDEGKLAIHGRLSNNLANLYAASSTKGQEIDTAMHYFGPTALGHMKWGYDEAAGFVSRYTEQGIAASTVGVFGRDLGSTEFMKKGVQARMYWEEFYRRGGKTREHLPTELEGIGAWRPSTGKKPDPVKNARYKEMTYRQSEYNKIMRSGNKDAQTKLIAQISQDLYKLEVAGAGGRIRAPESIQPMIKTIATSGTISEFVDLSKKDMSGVSADPAVTERGTTEKLRVESQAGALSVLSNQFTSGLEKFGEVTGLTGAIKRYGAVTNANDLVGEYVSAVKGGDFGAVKTSLEKLQRMRNAGMISEKDVADVKGFFYKKSANHPRGFDYVNVGGGKLGQDYVIDSKNTGGGIFGSPERKKIEENIIATYDKLNVAAGGNYLGTGSVLPGSMQDPGMRKVTAEEEMKRGKTLADVIKDGHMLVTINADQLKEITGAMGGRDNYSVSERGDGQFDLKVFEKSGPKKPQAPSAPPHNGMSPVTGQRYYWGEKPGGPPTIAENYTAGTAGANY